MILFKTLNLLVSFFYKFNLCLVIKSVHHIIGGKQVHNYLYNHKKGVVNRKSMDDFEAKLNFVIALPRLNTLGAVIFSLEIIPR